MDRPLHHGIPRDPEKCCVNNMISFPSKMRQLLSMKSIILLEKPKRTSGFGQSSVKGASVSPRPPARTKNKFSFIDFSFRFFCNATNFLSNKISCSLICVSTCWTILATSLQVLFFLCWNCRLCLRTLSTIPF